MTHVCLYLHTSQTRLNFNEIIYDSIVKVVDTQRGALVYLYIEQTLLF